MSSICRSVLTRAGSKRGFSTLVLADADAKTGLGVATYSVLTAANKIGKPVTFLANTKEAAEGASKLGKCYLAEGAKTADVLADVIKTLHEKENFTHILGSVSDTSRDTLPRLGAVLDVGVASRDTLPRLGAVLDVQPISEIIDVIDEKTFKRPTYGDQAIVTVESSDTVKVVTVRPTAFDATESGSAGSVEAVDVPESKLGSKFVAETVKQGDKPQLNSAKIVVSGGRALGSAENFEKVVQPLCDKLNAALGASRAAVDAGYVPNELQVGQTGQKVAPDLYIAVGISGAIQHLAGMKDSKTIVCINKDPDAPIFQVSDYGLVGDLFEEVPKMTEKC